jgi:hypothetical protein
MSESISYVYAYFRLDGVTPCYIGKGKGERWLHKSKAGGRNLHFVRLVAQARALGKELPRIKVAEGLTDSEAMQLEVDLIRLIGREANGGPLVNLTDGWDGPNGYKWTLEQIEAHKTRLPKTRSPEWRAAISAGLKGKPKSPEHVLAAAAARRGVKNKTGWWSTPEGLASHMTAESKQKIRQTLIANAARKAINISPTWGIQNSVRYNAVAA